MTADGMPIKKFIGSGVSDECLLKNAPASGFSIVRIKIIDIVIITVGMQKRDALRYE